MLLLVCGRYVIVFFFFFNGLSFHLSAAFASHLLGFRMSWGSTSKEVVDTNFFKEVRARDLPKSFPVSIGHPARHAPFIPFICSSVVAGNFDMACDMAEGPPTNCTF